MWHPQTHGSTTPGPAIRKDLKATTSKHKMICDDDTKEKTTAFRTKRQSRVGSKDHKRRRNQPATRFIIGPPRRKQAENFSWSRFRTPETLTQRQLTNDTTWCLTRNRCPNGLSFHQYSKSIKSWSVSEGCRNATYSKPWVTGPASAKSNPFHTFNARRLT